MEARTALVGGVQVTAVRISYTGTGYSCPDQLHRYRLKLFGSTTQVQVTAVQISYTGRG